MTSSRQQDLRHFMMIVVGLIAIGLLLGIPFTRKVILGLVMVSCLGFIAMTPYMLLTLIIYGIVHAVHKFR